MKKPIFNDCRYLQVEFDPTMKSMINGWNAEESFEAMSRVLDIVNCTPVYGKFSIGDKRIDGSYSGALGQLVEGVINSTTISYMLGSDSDPPIHIGPVVKSSEMSLIGMKPSEETTRLKINSWLTIFDLVTYAYLGIILTIFTIFFTFVSISLMPAPKKNRATSPNNLYRALRLSIKIAKRTMWNIFQILIGNYSFETPTITSKVAATFLCIAMFFLIFGIFSSLTSTDMIAMNQPPYVDSVERLVNDEEFEDVKLIIPSGLWHEVALKYARPETNEFKLWLRVNRTIPFNIDTRAFTMLVDLYINHIKPRKSVGGIDRTVSRIFKSLGCQMLNDRQSKNMHICSDTFAERKLVYVVSKSSDPRLLRWVNYYYRKVFEMNWFEEVFRKGATSFKINEEVSLTDVITCLEGKSDDPDIPEPVNIEFMSHAFYLLQLGILFSLLLVLFEVLICKLGNLIK